MMVIRQTLILLCLFCSLNIFAQLNHDVNALKFRPSPNFNVNQSKVLPDYCPSTGGSTQYEFIKEVKHKITGNKIEFFPEIFINNPEGCTAGEECPSYDDSPEYVNGWIDWNGDGQWTSSERVLNLTLTGYTAINYSGTMSGYGQATIPIDAVDTLTLRVNLGWGFDPNDPCQSSWDWGNVVDIEITLEKYNVDKLKVVGGNKIREIANDEIWEQEFNGSCALNNLIVDFDDLPFSAPLSKKVRLETTIGSCPAASEQPEVKCNWSIVGTMTSGTSSFMGWTGNIEITAPDKVGIYTVKLDYLITGADGRITNKSINRKLFVTKNSSLRTGSGIAKLKWFEKACEWAEGENDEIKIVDKLLASEYSYGNANWKYRYPKGTWQELADDTGSGFADCFVFSDLLENLAKVLGISGMRSVTEYGSRSRGFITVAGSPSLDPLFPGSARPAIGAVPDRYVFSTHSLRLKGGKYYDATFNKKYANQNDFVEWNFKDATGATVEGATVAYVGTGYHMWGDFVYTAPVPRGVEDELLASEKNLGDKIEFTGNVTFTTPDDDTDGAYDALIAQIEVNVIEAGQYYITGSLDKDGAVVAANPEFETTIFPVLVLDATTGTYTVELRFSGIEISNSEIDGPYALIANVADANGSQDDLAMDTPIAYNYTSFNNLGGSINQASESAIDLDSDSDKNVIRVNADLDISQAGIYILNAYLSVDDTTTIAISEIELMLSAGTHNVDLDLPGSSIRKLGIDGPFSIILTLVNDEGKTVSDHSLQTQAYLASEFDISFINIGSNYSDQGIDENLNGKFDWLQYTVEVDIEQAGTYDFITSLYQDISNTQITTAVLSDQTVVQGLNTLNFRFDGQIINGSQLNGEYSFNTVSVYDTNGNFIEQCTPEHLSTPYLFTDFELTDPEVSYTNESFTITTIDNNENNLYEILNINIDITSTDDGVASGYAELYDNAGNLIATGNGVTDVVKDITTPIQISFSGSRIYEKKYSGPFVIRNVYIYHTGNVFSGQNIDNFGSTSAFTYDQFEHNLSVLFGHWEHENSAAGKIPVSYIRPEDNQLFVHNFSNCIPKYCDWNEETADINFVNGNITLQWTTMDSIVNDTFFLSHVDTMIRMTHTQYTDDSGREDTRDTFRMFKNDCVSHLDITHLKGINETYWSANDLTSDGLIETGQNITVLGGNNIEFDSGFEVESGSIFEAKIKICGDNIFKASLSDKEKHESIEDVFPLSEKSLIHIKQNRQTDTTTLRYYLPKAVNPKVLIYDLDGNLLQTQAGKNQKGWNNVVLDISNLAEGVYYSILKTDIGYFSEKILVVK